MPLRAVLRGTRKLPENTSRLANAVLMGAVSGLAAVAFMVCVQFIFENGLERISSLPLPVFAAGSLLIVAVSSLAVGLLLGRLSPGSAGSGIPQLKTAFWKDLGFVETRHAVVKFIAGALSIGGGTSLGREGPSVYIGGAAASAAAGMLGAPRQARRRPLLMGAAAALAAAFNTPLAAMTFVLEEVLNDLNSRYLGSIILSAVVGAFVVHALIGRQPAFEMPLLSGVSWHVYALVPVVAGTGACVAGLFQRAVLSWRDRIRTRSRVPVVLRPLFGGMATWIIGITVFAATGKLGVFGLGYGDLSDVMTGRFGAWEVAGLLLLAKVVASAASYSWGGCGGIFSPTLLMGGLAGLFVSGAASAWIPMSEADRVVLCACGMSACFGTAVRAPFTAVLIVFEMTHQFSIVPALMLATLVSQTVARRFGRTNLYDALLEQDGQEIRMPAKPGTRFDWRSVPAASIASARPVFLESLEAGPVRDLLTRHPFQRFPVVRDGCTTGIVQRSDLERYLATGAAPPIHPAVSHPSASSVHEAAEALVGSSQGMIILTGGDGRAEAVLTLHDLVRAQVALTD